jgi:hypothetical protein
MRSLMKLNKSQIFIIGITMVSVTALLSVSIVMAALFTINTNNNSASDWSGVPVFQTDPSGDLNAACTGGDGTVDIIETYVASGPEGSDPVEWIYFRIRTASANAVSTENHIVSAYLDCPPFGEDIKDLNVMYFGYDDVIVFADGLLPNPDQAGSYGNPPRPEGERPADALDTVEWSVDYATFSGNPSYGNPRDPNCTPDSEAQIKFSTVKVTSQNQYVCTFDETTYSGFNLPTVVKINNFSTNSGLSGQGYLLISVIFLMTAIIICVMGFLYVRRKKPI